MARRASGYGRALALWARRYPLAPRYEPSERVWLRTVDGVRLAAARLDGPAGARFSVVLVHGLLGSSRTPLVHAFARALSRRAPVVVPDLRGHGGSGGRTTLGDLEALDVEAAVRAAAPGLPAVTVGMSMGAAAVLRHAALFGGVAGTVAISPPGWWAPRDRPGTARVERLVTSPAGRQLARRLLRTRIGVCDPRTPILELVDRIAPAFTIVVQDPADSYFAPEHGRALYERANDPKALWTVPGAGHGSDILTPAFAARLLDDLCARSGSI